MVCGQVRQNSIFLKTNIPTINPGDEIVKKQDNSVTVQHKDSEKKFIVTSYVAQHC